MGIRFVVTVVGIASSCLWVSPIDAVSTSIEDLDDSLLLWRNQSHVLNVEDIWILEEGVHTKSFWYPVVLETEPRRPNRITGTTILAETTSLDEEKESFMSNTTDFDSEFEPNDTELDVQRVESTDNDTDTETQESVDEPVVDIVVTEEEEASQDGEDSGLIHDGTQKVTNQTETKPEDNELDQDAKGNEQSFVGVSDEVSLHINSPVTPVDNLTGMALDGNDDFLAGVSDKEDETSEDDSVIEEETPLLQTLLENITEPAVQNVPDSVQTDAVNETVDGHSLLGNITEPAVQNVPDLVQTDAVNETIDRHSLLDNVTATAAVKSVLDSVQSDAVNETIDGHSLLDNVTEPAAVESVPDSVQADAVNETIDGHSLRDNVTEPAAVQNVPDSVQTDATNETTDIVEGSDSLSKDDASYATTTRHLQTDIDSDKIGDGSLSKQESVTAEESQCSLPLDDVFQQRRQSCTFENEYVYGDEEVIVNEMPITASDDETAESEFNVSTEAMPNLGSNATISTMHRAQSAETSASLGENVQVESAPLESLPKGDTPGTDNATMATILTDDHMSETKSTDVNAEVDLETTEKVEPSMTKAAPKAGSLASFFQKVSEREGSMGSTTVKHEAQSGISSRIAPEEAKAAQVLSGEEQTLEASTVKDTVGNEPKKFKGAWGVKHKKNKEAVVADIPPNILAHVLQSTNVPKEDESLAPELTSKLPASGENSTSEIVNDVEPLARIPKSVNTQFVEGLDDINKFLEAVDPPDELDVGAAGSSIQEVLIGQGAKMLTKRLVLGVQRVRHNIAETKAGFDRFFSRHTNEDGQFALVTREKVGQAARNLWKVTRRVVRRLQDFLEDVLLQDDYDDDVDDEELISEFEQQRTKLETIRKQLLQQRSSQAKQTVDADVETFIRERLAQKQKIQSQ